MGTCVRVTHPVDVVSRSLQLADQGHSASEVARMLGIPRATVRDWMRGKVPLRSGGPGAAACPTCGDAHDFSALGPAYTQLLGMYLGDGCLSPHPRGVFKLRLSLDARYPGVMEECQDAMREVMPRSRLNRISYGTWFEVYSYSKSWPCLLPQHGPGKKHERPIELTDWQWQLVRRRPDRLLRGLLHSDGCRFQSTGRGGWSHPRYSFTNTSGDIRAIFCAACDMLALRWTTSAARTIYVSRMEDVAVLDLLVGPKR
jgi:hypothetical protein